MLGDSLGGGLLEHVGVLVLVEMVPGVLGLHRDKLVFVFANYVATTLVNDRGRVVRCLGVLVDLRFGGALVIEDLLKSLDEPPVDRLVAGLFGML